MNLSVTRLHLLKTSSEQDEANNGLFDDDHQQRHSSTIPASTVSPRKLRAPTLTLPDSLPSIALEEEEKAVVDANQPTYSHTNGIHEEQEEQEGRDLEMIQPEERSVPRAVISNLPRMAKSLVTRNPKQALRIDSQHNIQQHQQEYAVFAFDEDNVVVLNRKRGLSWFKKSNDPHEVASSIRNSKISKSTSTSTDELEEIGDVSVSNTCLRFGEFSSDGSYFVFVHGSVDSTSISQQLATIVWNGSIVSSCALPSNGAGGEQYEICGLGFIQTEQDVQHLILASTNGRVYVWNSTDDFHSIREIEPGTKSTSKKIKELDYVHVLKDGRIVFVYSCSVEICLLDLRTFKLIPFQSLATFPNDAQKWTIRTKDFIRNALGMRRWRDFFRIKRSRVSKDGSILVLVRGTQEVCVVDISSAANKSSPHIVSILSSLSNEITSNDGDPIANLVTTKMDFVESSVETSTTGTEIGKSNEQLNLAMVRGRNVFISGLDPLEFKSVDYLASTSSSRNASRRTQTISLDQSSIDDICACILKPSTLLFVTRNGEVGKIKESTLEEIVWQLLEDRDYAGAMEFCRANNLSVDFVHKRIFESSPISSQSIQSHLALVEDHEWVLATCAERIPAESLDLCLELLRFGEQQVDLTHTTPAEQRQLFKAKFQELIERTEAFQICFNNSDLPFGSAVSGQAPTLSEKFDPQALRKFREGRSALDLAKRMAGGGKVNELLKFVYHTRFGGRILSSSSTSKEEQIQVLDAISEVVPVESYSRLVQDVAPSADWFIRRCTDMENKTGLVDQVFPLITLGLNLHPNSSQLAEFKRDFEAFVAVVLEFDSISFSKWKSMPDLEKLRAIWSTCGSKNLALFESKSRLIYPQGVLPPVVAKNWLKALREFIVSDLLPVLSLEELAALLLDSSADFYYRNRLDGRGFLLETARDCLDRVSLATDASEVAMHRRIQEMKTFFQRLDSMKDDSTEKAAKAAMKDFHHVRSELDKVKSKLEVFERCFVPYYRTGSTTVADVVPASLGGFCKNTPVIQCLAQLQSVDESFVSKYIQDLINAFQYPLSSSTSDSSKLRLDLTDVENVLYLADYAGVNSFKVKSRMLKQIFVQLKQFDLARAWIGQQQQHKNEEWLETAVIEAAKEFISREDLPNAKQTLSCMSGDDQSSLGKKRAATQRIWGFIEFLEEVKREDEQLKQELVSLELLLAFEKNAAGMLSTVLSRLFSPARRTPAADDDFPFDPSRSSGGRGHESINDGKEETTLSKSNIGSTTRLLSQVKKTLSSGMPKFNLGNATTGTSVTGVNVDFLSTQEDGLLRKLERWSSMLSLSKDELDWIVCEVVLKNILLVSSDEHRLAQARSLLKEWMSTMDSKNESSKLLFDALWSFSLMTKDAVEASRFRAEALLRAPYMSSKRAMELVDNLSRFNDQSSLTSWSNLMMLLVRNSSLKDDIENDNELERTVRNDWFNEQKKEHVNEDQWKLKCFASWLVHRELLQDDSVLNENLCENAVEKWKSELLQVETISQSRLVSILIAVGTLLTFYSPSALSRKDPLDSEDDLYKVTVTASKTPLERVLHSLSNLSTSNQPNQKGKRRRRSDWMKLVEEYLSMSTEEAEFVLNRCRFEEENEETNGMVGITRPSSTTQNEMVTEKDDGLNLEDILGDLDEERFVVDALYRFQIHQSIGRWIAAQVKLKRQDSQNKLEDVMSDVLNAMRTISGLSLSASFGDSINKYGMSVGNDPFQLLLSLDCGVEINSAHGHNRNIQLNPIFVQAYYACVDMVAIDSKLGVEETNDALQVFDLVLCGVQSSDPKSSLNKQQIMNGLDFATSVFDASTNGSEMINEDELYFNSSSSAELLLFKLKLVDKIGLLQADITNLAFKSKLESKIASLDEFLHKFFLYHVDSKGANANKKRSLLIEDGSTLNQPQLVGLLKQAGVGRPSFDSSSPEWIRFVPVASVKADLESNLIAIGELFSLSSSITPTDSSKSAPGGMDMIRFAKLVCEIVADSIKLRPSQVLCSLLLFLLLGEEGLAASPTKVPVTANEEEEEDIGFVLLQTRKLYESKCRSYLPKLVPLDLLMFAQRACFYSVEGKIKFNRETRMMILNDCLNALKRSQARKKNRAAAKSSEKDQESEERDEQEAMADDERIVQQSLELMRNVVKVEDLLASDQTLRRGFNQTVIKAIQTQGVESSLVQVTIRTFALDFLPRLQLDVLQMLFPNQNDLDSMLLEYFSSSLPASATNLLFEIPTSAVELMNTTVSSSTDALVLLANMVQFGLADPARLSAAKVDEKRDRVRQIIKNSAKFPGAQDWQSIYGKIHSSSEACVALEILNVFMDDFVAFGDEGYPGSSSRSTSTLTVEEHRLMSEIYLEALSHDFRVDVVSRLLPLWNGDQIRLLVEQVLSRLEKEGKSRELLEAWEFVLNNDATFEPCDSLLEQKARETKGNAVPLLAFLGRFKLRTVLDIWENQTMILRTVLEANSLKFSQSCARVFAEWILMKGSEEVILEVMAEHRRFPKILLDSPSNKAEFARLFFSQVLMGVENQTSKLQFASFQERSQTIELLHSVLDYLAKFALKWRDDRVAEEEEEQLEADFNEDELMKKLTPVKPKSKSSTTLTPAVVKAPEGEWAWEESPMTTKSVARHGDEFEAKAKPSEPLQQAGKHKKRLGLKAKRLSESGAAEVPISSGIDLLLSSPPSAVPSSITTPSNIPAEIVEEEPKKGAESASGPPFVAQQKPAMASSTDPFDLLLSSSASQHPSGASTAIQSKKASSSADPFDLLLSSSISSPQPGTTMVAKSKKATSKKKATKLPSEEDSSKLLDLMAAPVIGLLSSAVASLVPQEEPEQMVTNKTGGWDEPEELDLDVAVDVAKPNDESKASVVSSEGPNDTSSNVHVGELMSSSYLAPNELPAATIETVGQAGWDADLGIEDELDVAEKETFEQQETGLVGSLVQQEKYGSQSQDVDELVQSGNDTTPRDDKANVSSTPQADLESFVGPHAPSISAIGENVPDGTKASDAWEDDLDFEESVEDASKTLSDPVMDELVTAPNPSGVDLAIQENEAAQTWANYSLGELILNEDRVDQQKVVSEDQLRTEDLQTGGSEVIKDVVVVQHHNVLEPTIALTTPKLDEHEAAAQAWADDSLGELVLDKEDEPQQLVQDVPKESSKIKHEMVSELDENEETHAWAADSIGDLALNESSEHQHVVSTDKPNLKESKVDEEESQFGFDIERDRPKEAELYEEEEEEEQDQSHDEQSVTNMQDQIEHNQNTSPVLMQAYSHLGEGEEEKVSQQDSIEERTFSLMQREEAHEKEHVQGQDIEEGALTFGQVDLIEQPQEVEQLVQEEEEEEGHPQQEENFIPDDIAPESSIPLSSTSAKQPSQQQQQQEARVSDDSNHAEWMEQEKEEEEDESNQQHHQHRPPHVLKKATSSTNSEYVVKTCPDEVSRQVAGWLTRADLVVSSSDILPKSSADDIADLAREQTRLSHRFVEQTKLFSDDNNDDSEVDQPAQQSKSGEAVSEEDGQVVDKTSAFKEVKGEGEDQQPQEPQLKLSNEIDFKEEEEEASKAREATLDQESSGLNASSPSILLETKGVVSVKADPKKEQDPLALLLMSNTTSSTTPAAQPTSTPSSTAARTVTTPSRPILPKSKSTAATTPKPTSVALNVASDDPLALLLAPSTPSPKPSSSTTTTGTPSAARKSASKPKQQQQQHEMSRVTTDPVINRAEEGLLQVGTNPSISTIATSTTGATTAATETKKIAVKPRAGKLSSQHSMSGAHANPPPIIDPALDLLLGGGGPSTTPSSKSASQQKKFSATKAQKNNKEDKEPTKDEFLEMISGGL